MSFEGKVVVITGAASGIGLATAKHLASQGARLSLADVQEGALKSIVSEIAAQSGADKVTSFPVDVRDRKAVEGWIAHTTSYFNAPLDGAVNLAGVAGKDLTVANIEDVHDDDWDFVLGINLFGVLNCMRAQIPHMRDGGSIVNAASVAGVMGLPKHAAYAASKHGVIGLTRTAAKELAPRRVRCNAIAP
jgi:NAD(P)-dependent dehydrogenase (short-subunit alcohol dehydrogenase family)